MNEVADYVAQVRTALADLPAATRDELLEDLPEHLAEVAAEGEGTLAERLGPPAAYAADLRAAVGAPTGRQPLALDQRLSDAVARVRARLQVVDAKSGPLIGYGRGSDFLRLLRPAWWVARGYLVAMALAYLAADDPIGLLPRFDVGDRTVTGILVLVVFVIGSIWLGRRGSRLARVPRLALGIGTALLMLPALASIHRADDDAAGYPPSYQGVSETYDSVDSVYVYDEQGRPVFGAGVYDQAGNLVPPGLWACVDGAGAVVAEVHPKCADPRPLDWPDRLRVFPVEPYLPGAAPTETATPTPTPSGTATPTPTPSATG